MKQSSASTRRQNNLEKYNSLKNVYERIVTSSESEEESTIERASTPLPRNSQTNYRNILEIANASAEAIADEKGYFDVSADSLEMSCKKMRLNSTFESLESGALPGTSPENTHEEIRESLESPDQLTDEEEGFVVEIHRVPSPQSITSCMIAAYLEQVHREEDGASLFETPQELPENSFPPNKPIERSGKRSQQHKRSEHQYGNAHINPHAQSTREKCFPQRSGPVTTRSRLGMLLQASGDWKRAWLPPAITEMVMKLETNIHKQINCDLKRKLYVYTTEYSNKVS